MKKILNKNTLIILPLILLIIAGSIVLGVAGFEKSMIYKAGTKIEVYIPNMYEKEDIINIAKESFNGKDFLFEEVEKLNQVASIKLEEYTEEELNNFKTKISEKYEIEEKELEIYIVEVPKARVKTLVEPYVFPVVLVTVLSLIYVLFRNLKSADKWKNILKIILILAIVLGVYFILILIFRLPFGYFTMPLALAIYIITLIILVNNIKE